MEQATTDLHFQINMGSANFICVTNGHRGNDHLIMMTQDQINQDMVVFW